MTAEELLERLAAIDDGPSAERAPARLKSKIYSALVSRLTETGPLLSLDAIKQSGTRLCVFEEVVAALPGSAQIGSRNPCRICHARVLGERLEWAPIFWPGCPYSEFHND
jgi:hypothetical protein